MILGSDENDYNDDHVAGGDYAAVSEQELSTAGKSGEAAGPDGKVSEDDHDQDHIVCDHDDDYDHADGDLNDLEKH